MFSKKSENIYKRTKKNCECTQNVIGSRNQAIKANGLIKTRTDGDGKAWCIEFIMNKIKIYCSFFVVLFSFFLISWDTLYKL